MLTCMATQLEKKLENQESVQTLTARSTRNVDRTVRDLQAQIGRRDKQNAQLEDNISKSRDKLERLLFTIDELQSDDSKNQLAARRAERELREEKEKALRLERELEGWKSLRVERGMLGSAAGRGSEDGGIGGRKSSLVGSLRAGQEGAGVRRNLSNSKGFL